MFINIYTDNTGFSPFDEWFRSLNDKGLRGRILARLDRIEQGNLGDHKYIRDGIWELRFYFSPGIRIYFGRESSEIILLLFGGDKNSQSRDIKRATSLYNEYLRNKK